MKKTAKLRKKRFQHGESELTRFRWPLLFWWRGPLRILKNTSSEEGLKRQRGKSPPRSHRTADHYHGLEGSNSTPGFRPAGVRGFVPVRAAGYEDDRNGPSSQPGKRVRPSRLSLKGGRAGGVTCTSSPSSRTCRHRRFLHRRIRPGAGRTRRTGRAASSRPGRDRR